MKIIGYEIPKVHQANTIVINPFERSEQYSIYIHTHVRVQIYMRADVAARSRGL